VRQTQRVFQQCSFGPKFTPTIFFHRRKSKEVQTAILTKYNVGLIIGGTKQLNRHTLHCATAIVQLFHT